MYELLKEEGRAKRGVFHTVHGDIQTPVFMNVGTVAAIKGAVSTQDLQEIHRAQGRKGNVKQLIYTWTCRGYIERDEQDQAYVKTNKYLNRHANV